MYYDDDKESNSLSEKAGDSFFYKLKQLNENYEDKSKLYDISKTCKNLSKLRGPSSF